MFCAEHKLFFTHLDGTTTDLGVAATDRHRDVADREIVGVQPVRIDRDLVLLYVAADRGHFRHAFDAGELVAEEPILHRAKFSQVVGLGVERIHKRPAHAGCIGPEAGSNIGGQFPRDAVEIFQHAAACPVGISAIFKNHIHERVTIE
jgi:hypothetical protein